MGGLLNWPLSHLIDELVKLASVDVSSKLCYETRPHNGTLESENRLRLAMDKLTANLYRYIKAKKGEGTHASCRP